jgi:hypothetical protein
MVIKFPVVGAGVVLVVVVVVEEEPQPVNNPARSAAPIKFTNLPWGIRLKSLLQSTSGNVTWPRQAGNTGDAQMSISTDPRLFLR